MRPAFRLIALSLILTAFFVVSRPTTAAASRCFVDQINYFEDETCGSLVGTKLRDCEGSTIGEWGVTSPYYEQWIDGGDSYCFCGGDEYHTYNHLTCPA